MIDTIPELAFHVPMLSLRRSEDDTPHNAQCIDASADCVDRPPATLPVDLGRNPFAVHGNSDAAARAHTRNLLGIIFIAVFLVVGVTLYLVFGKGLRRRRALKGDDPGGIHSPGTGIEERRLQWDKNGAPVPSIQVIPADESLANGREISLILGGHPGSGEIFKV